MTPQQPQTTASETPAAEVDLVEQFAARRSSRSEVERVLVERSDSGPRQLVSGLAGALHRAAALLAVSRGLADSLSLEVLLPRMVELISEFLDAERCTVFLYDRETDELYTRAALGLSGELRIPAGHGIAGAVFRGGAPVIIADAYQDPRFNADVDLKTGFRTRDILCVPVRHREAGVSRDVGVAQVLNKRNGRFGPEDMALLDALNSQAAPAFANALLHEEIARARAEEARLLEVTAALSTELQLQPLLVKIMDAVTAILEADRATLFLYDRKSDELWALVGRGEGAAQIRFPSRAGLAGHVFQTAQTINIPDAYADDRFNRDVDRRTGYRTRNMLCMPVINRKGETIAVTQVLNKKGGPFTAIDEKRLRAFSAQAAVAMENAQLFDEVTRVKNYNESILESMSNGVLSVDADGLIVKANRAALELLRHQDRPEGLLARPARDFFAGPNAWIAGALDDVRRTGKPSLSMDAHLHLPAAEAPAAEAATASINLTVVPLAALADEAAQGCILMIEDITTEKRLKTTMARYMTKEVADKLLEEGEAALGGKMQKASILFTDIRSFTTISETIGPQETVSLLNEYFGLMVDIIFEKGGILDKYIGDAIMAVFGAPFSAPEDADHAVEAAILMLRALRQFNSRRALAGEAALHMGIGVNTDEVLSGNIGSLRRMDYTVIGDGVNLASRLEGINKSYGTEILLSEMTVRALKRPILLREVDRIRVKGKSQPVGVFEVLEHFGEGSRARDPVMLKSFDAGLQCYRMREWSLAAAAFEEVLRLNPRDGVSRLYRDRCDYFSAHPPEPDWDGVWVMKEK